MCRSFDPYGSVHHDASLDAARLDLFHPHWRAQQMLSRNPGHRALDTQGVRDVVICAT